MAVETTMFILSVLIGIGLGMLYDLFRICRVAFKSGAVIIFIEDILYFVVCTVVTFVFILSQNHGVVRGFVFLGEILGFVIYYFTLGRLVISVANYIIMLVKKILMMIFRVTIGPIVVIFVFIAKKIARVFVKYKQRIVKMNKNYNYHLKRRKIILYNISNTHKRGKKRNEKK